MLSTRISLIILVILSPFHLISFCLKRTNAVQCHSDSRYGYFGTNFKSEAHFARFDWNDNKILCLLYCSRIRTISSILRSFFSFIHIFFSAISSAHSVLLFLLMLPRSLCTRIFRLFFYPRFHSQTPHENVCENRLCMTACE